MNYQDNEAFQEALPPIETALFECLAKLCTVRYFDLPEGHPHPVSDPARKDKACQHCDYRALCNTEQVL
jgi:hypothetical protein